MAEQVLLDALKQGYKLWSNKDESAIPYFMGLMSDDVKWSSLANGCEGALFTKARTGKSEVIQYFTELVDEWELVTYNVHEFVSENDRIVMLGNCSFKHRVSGIVVESPKVDVFRHNGTKITEFMEFYDSHKLVCAAQMN